MTKIIAALGDSITQGYFDSTGAGWFGRLAAKISENQTCGFHNISANNLRKYYDNHHAEKNKK